MNDLPCARGAAVQDSEICAGRRPIPSHITVAWHRTAQKLVFPVFLATDFSVCDGQWSLSLRPSTVETLVRTTSYGPVAPNAFGLRDALDHDPFGFVDRNSRKTERVRQSFPFLLCSRYRPHDRAVLHHSGCIARPLEVTLLRRSDVFSRNRPLRGCPGRNSERLVHLRSIRVSANSHRCVHRRPESSVLHKLTSVGLSRLAIIKSPSQVRWRFRMAAADAPQLRLSCVLQLPLATVG